ncbi:MAG TPA: methylated-DNA--[protein]-cysteine S-methyltransferase [Nitrospirota bacterium]|nr:methylated-DNA--[protein]-cysteine S-methyltransferase [Nitrospirota bacterium]
MKNHIWLRDYQRIEKVILFLDNNFHRQPRLKDIAQSVDLSTYHLQRLFKRWAGISPKRFLQILTIEHVKQIMRLSSNLLDITYESGLSSTGRLHDLFVNVEAVTPGEFRRQGEHLKIHYGFHPSPFGVCFIAVTNRGICCLDFVEDCDREKIAENLKKQWRLALTREDSAITRRYIDQIFGCLTTDTVLPLHLKGTNFQIKVWKALLNIPRGMIASYENVAGLIRKPQAIRAVSNAIAHNPVAFVIPCHRVIRKTGAMGGYRWGLARKKAILAWETKNKEFVAYNFNNNKLK